MSRSVQMDKKQIAGVGAAAANKNTVKTLSLPDIANIFTAELQALNLAITLITKSNKTHFMILTDSISVLKAMSNINYRNSTIRILQHNVDSLTKKGKQIKFVWVPGHCAIACNEKADTAAKYATTK